MKNKEKNFVSAVIYIHNAQEQAADFLHEIIHVLERNFSNSEIICVNDASEDNSREQIREIGTQAVSTSVSIIDMSHYHGLEASMNAGVDLAIGDFVFEFDNTVLDFDSNEVMKVYRHALEGYDIVSASPDRREHLSSRLFYQVFERFAELPYRMGTESFRILSRRVINRISAMNRMIPYRKALYANCGLKTDCIKYSVLPSVRKHNTDKLEKSYKAGLAIDSLLLFTGVGYRFSIWMTFLMMFLSMFMTIYCVIVYITMHPVAGWTTTVLFLSVAFFGLFGIQTVIIKYLQILTNLVFKKKYYNFENIEKLTK